MQITKKIIIAGAGFVALASGGGAAYATATAASPSVETFTAAPAPKVSAEQAMQIAHGKVQGAWVSELDFDLKGSRPDVWEIELTKGQERHEIDVDATSGKIVKHETDRVGQNGDDDRDDDHDDDDHDDDDRDDDRDDDD
ncbi:hypothetical protein E1286_29115 [Nonomuraea terrae]|uniref:PepSY domain-containing protein n=1 Tax=Nonomuraea terrae TaxID=2530383 RepID=A0A4V2YKQ8_9ACTN|nr:PepSY domain-containing protein [Nonomuraea terrae]TDD43297.1 hypothetical protein E1286_29115 [Nonomuraea terrae]